MFLCKSLKVNKGAAWFADLGGKMVMEVGGWAQEWLRYCVHATTASHPLAPKIGSPKFGRRFCLCIKIGAGCRIREKGRLEII